MSEWFARPRRHISRGSSRRPASLTPQGLDLPAEALVLGFELLDLPLGEFERRLGEPEVVIGEPAAGLGQVELERDQPAGLLVELAEHTGRILIVEDRGRNRRRSAHAGPSPFPCARHGVAAKGPRCSGEKEKLPRLGSNQQPQD